MHVISMSHQYLSHATIISKVPYLSANKLMILAKPEIYLKPCKMSNTLVINSTRPYVEAEGMDIILKEQLNRAVIVTAFAVAVCIILIYSTLDYML